MHADILRLEPPWMGPFPQADQAVQEQHRLALLETYCVLDTQPDVLCDLVTELAATLFNTEIALVSLVAEHRQWFKSRRGLEAAGTPRSQSFCSHAIEQEQVMVVLDATQDARFADNPLVTGEPGIRFYAGAPLLASDGLRLGTLCLIGKSPRAQFSAAQADTLAQLAAIVMARLDSLRVSSYVDSLTSLPNRSRLLVDLQSLQALAGSSAVFSDKLTAVAVDICDQVYLGDMIKALGWDYVEGFLVQATERLRQALGEVALYRIGTTSFAYLERKERWQEQARQVERAFARTVEHQGIPHHLEVSVGIVPLSQCTDADELVPSLLTATDVARECGSRRCHYEQPLGQMQKHSFELLSAIPAALFSSDQLWLEFQPKVGLLSGQCAGVEALLRWRHPVHGVISPGLFIPLAEKSALIRQVTLWVLQHGIEQAAAWARQGRAIPVAINVSARDFDNDDLVQTLAVQLRRHRLPAGLIEIEFTESAMSKHPEKLYSKIQVIKRLGVKVAIDDFGAGFSNLSYLKNIPADYLKIDQSFIRNMESNYSDQQIVPSMIHLGQKLGFAVVAEGVETERCRRILQHLGCEYGQGYGIARPMSAADTWDWIAARD
ncbi:sensor domain-containing phosphodiesterase [Herbaspirillum rubrisubalbicans]|uniref:Phosphodiesterase n=1 Tax=Herbaspirillum rubrisubalbicans TaxID=80842 RepID=A0ABX9BWS4_9BURK|nr:GGDEF and EAL domain-containing protein [Herbaspirillum rubrisubalbicans]RAM62377.1 phosphodiesterase [Herbaspirillum rubrisubalbicans]